MPTCKKCNNNFPNRIIIDGKEKYLNSRSYCLICSPLGSDLGYDLRKRATDENYKTLFNSLDSLICPICEREFPRKRKCNRVCSTCRMNYVRYVQRQKGIDILGGKCSNCDEADCEVLQFHHKNPAEKEFTLSANWANKDWDKLEKEINKCELLCSNCHIKLHRKDINKIIEFFTASGEIGETHLP